MRELRGLLEQARQEAESAERQLADATQGKEVAEAKVRAVLGLWSYFLPAARHEGFKMMAGRNGAARLPGC